MAKHCESFEAERHIEVYAWSGDRSDVVCALSNPNKVNHWVRIENYKSVPIGVNVEAIVGSSAYPLVEFDCPGAANVTTANWKEKDIMVPPKKKGWRSPPGTEERGYVTLRAVRHGGSTNVFTTIETDWYPNESHSFSLDIRINT